MLVAHIFDSNWPFGLIGCQVYFLTDFIGMACSVYSLVFLSLGRCIMVTIKNDKFLKCIKKDRYVIILMVLVWLISIILSLPGLISIKLDQSLDGSFACGSKWNEKETSIFFILKFVILFLFPFTSIFISSIKLILFLRSSNEKFYVKYTRVFFPSDYVELENVKIKQKNRFSLPNINLGKRSLVPTYKYEKRLSLPNKNKGKINLKIIKPKKNNVHKKVVKMILAIVFLFVIQWIPIWVFELLATKHSEYIQFINIITTVLSHSNSISNPLVYIILSHNYPFIGMLRKFFRLFKRNPSI